jgi:hypothetical protein
MKNRVTTACGQGSLPLLPLGILAGTASVATGMVLFLPLQAQNLTAENGIIEAATAFLFGLAVILAALHLKRTPTRVWLAGLLVLVWLYLRELDHQKQFTGRSIASIRFFTDPEIAWLTKVIALACLLPFGLSGLYLFGRLLKRLQKGLRASAGLLCYLGIGIIMVVTAQAAEKWGLDRNSVIEEIFELGFAVTAVCFLCSHPERPAGSFACRPGASYLASG